MVLANLFAKNPFTPLTQHMKKAQECVAETRRLFAALEDGDKAGVAEAAKRISTLEHEADVLKQEIRSRLTKGVFMPVDRRDVLQVLESMDAIADYAEDIGVLLTLRWMEVPEPLAAPLRDLRARVEEVVETAGQVIDGVDMLLESGFSAREAERVNALVDEVGRREHLADKAQDVFGKRVFAHEDDLKPAALLMWLKIGKSMGDIANAAESMCNALRLMLSGT